MWMKTMKIILTMAIVAALGSAALASTPLPAGSGLANPNGFPIFPAYGTVFPTGLTELYSVTNPIISTKTSLGGPLGTTTIAMAGDVTTTLWKNATGQLTFEYQFNETGNSQLETASFSSTPWVGVQITDAGADTSGQSKPNSDFPFVWSNGAPAAISRDLVAQNPYISWTLGSTGTYLIGTDPITGLPLATGLSADIWFSTNATGWQYDDTSLQDSSVNGKARLLVPGTNPPVPEPITMAGVLLGVGALGRYWSRKQTNAVK